MKSVKSVKFVYHAVPSPMLGSVLYPLNMLKSIYPDIYETHVRKYDWRRSFLNLTVPRINCLWNDVLHFSIIHPSEIRENLWNSGSTNREVARFFEVPVELLVSLPYAVYYTPPPVLDNSSYDNDQQAPGHVIDPALVKMPHEYDFIYPEFSEATRQYYSHEFQLGRRPLAFNGLPHFLLKGSLDIAGIRVIDC
jgi:hypothetical protein